GHNSANISTGIEDAGGECALAFRELLRNCLDRSGKTARLSDSETESGQSKFEDRSRRRVSHGRQAPEQNCCRKAHRSSASLDELSDQQRTDPIGHEEHGYDVAVPDLAPPELHLQSWLEQREALAIHLIDRGGKKQQRA